MYLNPTIESAYKSILDYGGMTLEEDGSLTSYNDKPTMSRSGDIYHLPYLELTKFPQGKSFFHILNENYRKPESEAHNIFRNNATLALNVRFAHMASTLLMFASSPEIQKNIQHTDLMMLMSDIGDVDQTTVTNFDKVIKAAEKEKGLGFFFTIFVKKDAKIGDRSYQAIGKVNCSLYKEAVKAQEKTERGYEIYGTVVRKRDVETYLKLVELMLPGIDNEDNYTEGVLNNKIFRCLDAFLRTSYLVASRVNEIARWINEELQDDSITKVISNIQWSLEDYDGYIGKLYDIGNEIALLGNHDNVQVEAKIEREEQVANTRLPQRLNIDDSAAAKLSPGVSQPPPREERTAPPAFNPGFGSGEPTSREPEPQATSGGNSITDLLRNKGAFEQYGLEKSIPYGTSIPEIIQDRFGDYYLNDMRTGEMIPCDAFGNPIEFDIYGNPIMRDNRPPEWLEQDMYEQELRAQGIDPRRMRAAEEARMRAEEARHIRMTGGYGQGHGMVQHDPSWRSPNLRGGAGYGHVGGHGGYYDDVNNPNPGAYDYGVGGYDNSAGSGSPSRFGPGRFVR